MSFIHPDRQRLHAAAASSSSSSSSAHETKHTKPAALDPCSFAPEGFGDELNSFLASIPRGELPSASGTSALTKLASQCETHVQRIGVVASIVRAAGEVSPTCRLPLFCLLDSMIKHPLAGADFAALFDKSIVAVFGAKHGHVPCSHADGVLDCTEDTYIKISDESRVFLDKLLRLWSPSQDRSEAYFSERTRQALLNGTLRIKQVEGERRERKEREREREKERQREWERDRARWKEKQRSRERDRDRDRRVHKRPSRERGRDRPAFDRLKSSREESTPALYSTPLAALQTQPSWRTTHIDIDAGWVSPAPVVPTTVLQSLDSIANHLPEFLLDWKAPEKPSFAEDFINKRHPDIVEQLYGGVACGACGLRFPDHPALRVHLDNHFAENRQALRVKESVKAGASPPSRGWLGAADAWTNDKEVKPETSSALSVVEHTPKSTVPEGAEPLCCICREDFATKWDDDLDSWACINAALLERGLMHPQCEPPSPITPEQSSPHIVQLIDPRHKTRAKAHSHIVYKVHLCDKLELSRGSNPPELLNPLYPLELISCTPLGLGESIDSSTDAIGLRLGSHVQSPTCKVRVVAYVRRQIGQMEGEN